MTTAIKSGYAPVNGIDLYYEIYGEGYPVILLHGGLGAIEMFGDLAAWAQGRQVIGVDLQAHGRTANIDRPMSYEAMADDIAALIPYLGFEQADVMGYSLGGGVAIQTAIRHPEVARKLVAVSAPHKKSAWYPDVQAGMAQMSAAAAEPMKQSPMYALYAQIAPRPQDWSVLLDKTGDLLRRDYDYTEAVKSIQAPTMIVIGDADSISPRYAAEFFELMGGGQRDAGWDGSGVSKSRLAILPGATHYNIFSSPMLTAAVTPFMDA